MKKGSLYMAALLCVRFVSHMSLKVAKKAITETRAPG